MDIFSFFSIPLSARIAECHQTSTVPYYLINPPSRKPSSNRPLSKNSFCANKLPEAYKKIYGSVATLLANNFESRSGIHLLHIFVSFSSFCNAEQSVFFSGSLFLMQKRKDIIRQGQECRITIRWAFCYFHFYDKLCNILLLKQGHFLVFIIIFRGKIHTMILSCPGSIYPSIYQHFLPN